MDLDLIIYNLQPARIYFMDNGSFTKKIKLSTNKIGIK